MSLNKSVRDATIVPITHQCVAVNVLLPLLLRRDGIVDRRIAFTQQLNSHDILLGQLSVSRAPPNTLS